MCSCLNFFQSAREGAVNKSVSGFLDEYYTERERERERERDAHTTHCTHTHTHTCTSQSFKARCALLAEAACNAAAASRSPERSCYINKASYTSSLRPHTLVP
jgi:hypothetical protein